MAEIKSIRLLARFPHPFTPEAGVAHVCAICGQNYERSSTETALRQINGIVMCLEEKEINAIAPDGWTLDAPVSRQLARLILFETQRTLEETHAAVSLDKSPAWGDWAERIKLLCATFLEHYDQRVAYYQRLAADAVNANPRPPMVIKGDRI